ncbi:unnamed protein product [Amoebophrya sp. A120]|nr:unnamed protein product [Amoebophrya sp. A120]|eukprot:GSA120T00011185001.1
MISSASASSSGAQPEASDVLGKETGGTAGASLKRPRAEIDDGEQNEDVRLEEADLRNNSSGNPTPKDGDGEDVEISISACIFAKSTPKDGDGEAVEKENPTEDAPDKNSPSTPVEEGRPNENTDSADDKKKNSKPKKKIKQEQHQGLRLPPAAPPTFLPLPKLEHDPTDEMYGNLPKFHPGENIIIGIDEAGRGPVLGPMIYGLAYAPEKADLKALIATELDDSKKLSVLQRTSMFGKVQENVGWIAHVSSAEKLSRDMTGSTKVSLNLIAQTATVNAIKLVLEKQVGSKVSALYVDTVGDPDRYANQLKAIFPQIPTIIVAKKADSLYKIVSAASVVAKVCRDHMLEEFAFPEESEKRERKAEIVTREFGCGYPGDKQTIKWMGKNVQHVFGFPKLVRFSWETTDKLMEKNCAKVEFYEELETELANKQPPPLTAFFAKSNQPARKKCFLQRGLGVVTDF